MVVDMLARRHGMNVKARRGKAVIGEGQIAGEKVILVKPMTFMNLSGRSVRQAVQFYKLDPATDLMVICDDISLPLGKLRIRPKGSDGGQKGLRDLIAQLGTQDFPRLRIGVGDPGPIDAAEYVLGRWRNTERPVIDDALIEATQAIAVWVTQGLEAAMNRYNRAASLE